MKPPCGQDPTDAPSSTVNAVSGGVPGDPCTRSNSYASINDAVVVIFETPPLQVLPSAHGKQFQLEKKNIRLSGGKTISESFL